MSTKNLRREAELAEENYMLYVRKQENARISNELDRHRIVNVSVVESASVPYSPTGPPKGLLASLGTVFGAATSILLVFATDRWGFLTQVLNSEARTVLPWRPAESSTVADTAAIAVQGSNQEPRN